MNKRTIYSLISSTVIFCMSFNLLNISNEIEWKSMADAVEASKNDGKPIFVDVYTDWCGWCKILDKKTFSNEEVINYVQKNYHAVKLNPEKEGEFVFKEQSYTNESFATTHDVNSYPAIIMVHPEGKDKVYVGYRDSESFLEILKKYKRQVD